jgi:flagellin-like hook-associated protein FlgL
MKITKNDVISVDFAELSSYFSALSLNYQAMLQSVAKVQNMSLVNYI